MSFNPTTGFGLVLTNYYAANLRSPDPTEKADALVAYSFLYDRRIPPHRAAVVEALSPTLTHDPKQIIDLYRGKKLKPGNGKRDYETFGNACNYRQGCSPHPPAVAGTQFISVVRLSPKILNRMALSLDKSGYKNLEKVLPAKPNKQEALREYAARLSGRMRSAFPATQDFHQFIRLVTAAKSKMDGVQWTAPARQFDACIAWLDRHHRPRDLGNDWFQVLGVPHYAGEVLLLFRYTAVDAKKLYRPTHLDAGWYQHHFPSPVTGSTHDQGHTMHIGLPIGQDAPLVDEYIHRPVSWVGAHLSAITLTTKEYSSGNTLPPLRQRQWKKLARRYTGFPMSHSFMPSHTGAVP